MSSSNDVEKLINLENEQKWKELLESARLLVKEHPDQSAEGYYYQGVAFHELRKYLEAQQSYTKSMALNNHDPLVHNALGVLYKDRKKYDEALLSFDKAYELNPGFLNARINKAQTYSLKGMNNEALAIYNEILKEDGDIIPVLIFKAECLKELKQFNQAVATYDHAISLEPNAADLHLNKGNVFAIDEKNEQALQSYERAIQADPKFADAYHNAGLIYQKLGNDQEAIRCFKTAIEKDSQSPLPFITLGQLYSRNKNDQMAEQIFQDGIRQNPNSPLCTYSYGLHKIKRNNFEGGIAQLSASVSALDDPDTFKHQFERSLMDIKRSKNEVQAKIEDQTKYKGISFSNAGAVAGLDLATENQAEIPTNINLLKERLDNSLSEVETLKAVGDSYETLSKINPPLFKYASHFLLMQTNFIRNSEFQFVENSNRSVNLDVLNNNKLTTALDKHTKGNLAIDLITSSVNSHISKSEFRNQFNQILSPSAEGFDREDASTVMTQTVLKKINSSNEKLNEINEYEDNSNTKRFITKIVEKYPELSTETKDPSVAVALKDFILINSHLVENNSYASKSPRNYSIEFEKKYFSGAFEDVKESKLTGGISTFQSTIKNNARDLEVTLLFENKLKATSKSQFVVQAVISKEGKIPPKPDLQGGYYKQVFASHPISLEQMKSFKFTILGTDINDSKIDNVFLKIAIFKKKSETNTQLKVDQNILISSLSMNPQQLMILKQQRMLTTQNINVYITGNRNW